MSDRTICDEKLGSKELTHSCYLRPHGEDKAHECACSKRWWPKQSYDNVTRADKKAS